MDRPSIWNVINQDKPPRALDPETHLPFPALDWKWKMANYFLEKWGRKLILKILIYVQPWASLLSSWLGNTPATKEQIGIAVGMSVLGLIDIIVSKLTGGRVQSLQRIQEDAEKEGDNLPQPLPWIDPQPTLTNIQPLGFQAQDKATAQAIREAKKTEKLPEFTVRHKSAKKGARWNVAKYHDREIAQSRFDTLVATKKDGLVEITGPGIP